MTEIRTLETPTPKNNIIYEKEYRFLSQNKSSETKKEIKPLTVILQKITDNQGKLLELKLLDKNDKSIISFIDAETLANDYPEEFPEDQINLWVSKNIRDFTGKNDKEDDNRLRFKIS